MLLDPKYIYLTNSSSYLKTVYKVLSELTDDIGIDFEARFFKIGVQMEQVAQQEITLGEETKNRHFVKFEMDSYQDQKFDMMLSLYPRLKMIVFVEDAWKLAGTRALAIHPNCDYAIFVQNKQFYCMSHDGFL